MAIEVVHTKGGPRGRDTATGKFTSLKVPNGKGVITSGADFANASQMSMDFGSESKGVVPVVQEGSLVSILTSIQSGIQTLVAQTGQSLGMNQQQLEFDFKESKGDDVDRRQKSLDRAETDKVKKKGPLFGEGFLNSLKNAFGNVKEKFNNCDNL